MSPERNYEYSELEYCAQELAFRSYADLSGYAYDIEKLVMADLEALIDDPYRNRFVDHQGDIYVIEWKNQDLFWNYDEDERTLIEVDLEPIMDVYYGNPHFEISAGYEELVKFVKLDEPLNGYEIEVGFMHRFWSEYYISSFESALEKQRPRFLSEVAGYYCFTWDGYYNMDYMQEDDVINLIRKSGEECYDWEYEDKEWALRVLGYDDLGYEADDIFDNMLSTYLSGVSFEHILGR